VTLEPDLPFELPWRERPLSLQGFGSFEGCMEEAIREAAQQALPRLLALYGTVAITIYIFPRAEMQGDVDNRVNPFPTPCAMCLRLTMISLSGSW